MWLIGFNRQALTLAVGIICALTCVKGFSHAEGGPGQRIVDLQNKIKTDNRNDPEASIAWEKEGLRILAEAPNPGLETWFLRSLLRDQNTLGAFADASATLERAESQVSQCKDVRGRLLLDVEAASLLTNRELAGEARLVLGSALPEMKAYWVAHPQDNEMALALGRGYRILGLDLQAIGNSLEGIHAFQQALKISEQNADRRGQARVLDEMGNLYTAIGRYEAAIESHQQAAALAQDLGDVELQTICRLSLANTFGQHGEIERQVKTLCEAKDLARSARDRYLLLLAEMNLADAYLRMNRFAAALACAEGALRSPGIASYPKFVAVSMANRGIALNRLGRSEEGVRAIRDALRHFKDTGAVAETLEVTGNLAEEMAFSKDYRNAYETEVELLALTRAMTKDHDRKQIAEASAAFEADKKQFRIERLQDDQRRMGRLRVFWVSLGILGFALSMVLVVNRRRLQRSNLALRDLNAQNAVLIDQLQSALAEVRILQGLIPICSYCKKIRDDQGFWNQLEAYLQMRTEARFSHGICPDCAKDLISEMNSDKGSETHGPLADEAPSIVRGQD
jgi:tetratricopeptide (TPR) repeat protein